MTAQGEWSSFRGQDKKIWYSERKERRGDTQWIAREKGGSRLGSQGRTSLFNSNKRVSLWKIVGWFWIRRLLVTQGTGYRWEEARLQRAANPGGMEGVEVKTGYFWKEFDWSRREVHLECRVWGYIAGCLDFKFVSQVCVRWWGYFPLSLLPFNKRDKFEVLRYKCESLMKPSRCVSPPVPQGEEDI